MGLCFDEKSEKNLPTNNGSSKNGGNNNKSKEELNLKP